MAVHDGRKRPHILMMPLGLKGHFPVFIHVLHHMGLHCSGQVKVTVISSEEVVANLSTLQAKGVFGQLELQLVGAFAPIPLESDPKAPVNVGDVLERQKREFQPLRLKMVESRKLNVNTDIDTPTCLVADSFLQYTKDFADEAGIKWIPVYTFPTWLCLAQIHHSKIMNDYTKYSPEQVDIPGLDLFRISDIPSEIWDMPEFHAEHKKLVESSSAVLVNSPEFLEAQVGAIAELRTHLKSANSSGTAPKVYTIGPRCQVPGFGLEYSSKLSTKETKDDCLTWLDKQPSNSVLYIAVGSLGNLVEADMIEVAQGLEASGVSFLWNLKIPKSSTLADSVPPGFLERTKDRGFVSIGWAPQTHILVHSATGGFLSHCGWNSIIESITSGVPLITSPIFADQVMNARVITDVWKVGVPVTPGFKYGGYAIHRAEVEKAVRSLMFEQKGNEVRKNLQEQKEQLLACMAEGGSSDSMLRSFAKELMTF